VGARVKADGQTDLPEVVPALGVLGGILGFRQSRQQHRRENRDDGNDHQQFNQRKGSLIGSSSVHATF
jgi:hypothetical protein